MAKTETAFRTISEVAGDTGVAQHILRYWETRFPQLRPLQRAGNRRYYRPADIALVRRIDELLNRQGYTIKGVQALLAMAEPVEMPASEHMAGSEPAAMPESPAAADLLAELRMIRDAMAEALAADG